MQAITVHSPEVREPRPLSLHHLPLPITFALWEVRWWTGCADCIMRDKRLARGCVAVEMVQACKTWCTAVHPT